MEFLGARGESISSISRSLDRRSHSGVQQIIAIRGGIAPLERHRAITALRLDEREEIYRGLAAGLPIRGIARDLGRSPSTICREIARNGGARGYRATRADKQAWIARCGRSAAVWRAMGSYASASRRSWRSSGRRSR